MLVYPTITFIIGLTYFFIITTYYKNSDAHKTIFNLTVYVISILILFFSALKKKLLK